MEPSLADGIAYWEKQDANINGVLGVYHFPRPRYQNTWLTRVTGGHGYGVSQTH
jgi:hypothetical protein